MGRSVLTGTLTRLQADFFSAPSVRAEGVLASDITVSLFYNNSPVSWSIRDGASTPDSSISSGTVFFSEIAANPGFYSVRLFPDRVGYWRIVLRSTSLAQESVYEFDVIPAAAAAAGLSASFAQ